MSVNIFKNGILSKIAGAVGDAVPLINNFLTNQAGKGAADANTVYVLNNKIDELNSSINKLYCFDKELTGTYSSENLNSVEYEIDIPSECPFIPRYVFSQANYIASMYTSSVISNGKIQVRVCNSFSGTFSVNFKFMLVE